MFSGCQNLFNPEPPVNTVEGLNYAFQNFNGTVCYFAQTDKNNTTNTHMYILGKSNITNRSFAICNAENKLLDSAVYSISEVLPDQTKMVVPDKNGNAVSVTVTIGIAQVVNTYGSKIRNGEYLILYGKGNGIEIIEIMDSNQVNKNTMEYIAMIKM